MKVPIPLQPRQLYLLPSKGVRARIGRLASLQKRFPRTGAIPVWIAGCLLLIPQVAIFGQTLRLSPASGRQGERVAIEISLKSAPGKEPQVLQWETTIPAAQLSFVDDDMSAGPAAQAAGKSFACALKTNAAGTRTSLCILAGGLQQIQNGVVALLWLRILPQAPIGPVQVRTERGIAVMKGLKEVPLPPEETVVVVRPTAPPARK